MSTDTILNHYGNYLFLTIALSFLLILVLLYKLNGSKKSLKSNKQRLNEKEKEIESLYEVIARAEHKESEDKHQWEKEALQLNHNIQNLEDKLKEGIKSQVISKVMEYQNKRSKILERIGIES